MSLKDLMSASEGATKTITTNTTFGAVLRVQTAVEVDGGLRLTGVTMTGNSRLAANSEISVIFRGDASKALSNFVKGHDKKVLQSPDNAAGSYVMLESCYLTGQVDGDRSEVSSRWINTLAAVNDSDHANRSFVESVYATAPRLAFDNHKPEPGEPARITLPANASSIRARVVVDGKSADREFSRDWAVEKLKALSPKSKVAVTIDTIEPQEARKVGSRAEMDAALRDQLGRGTKAISMIRITDGNDVMSRMVYVPFMKVGDSYMPDVEKAMAELYERNIIAGIKNEKLVAAIDSGDYTVEVVPGYRMTYAGDTTRDNNAAYKLVSDVKTGRALVRNEAIFGNDPARFAKVILGGIARNLTVDGFSPTLVITEEPGIYGANEFATPHVRPVSAVPAALSDDASEEEEEPAAPRP